ncbi:hypothetical protein AJ78_07769 [Emergomyces pasteurianus Ep9510]|uniref:Uncharacterized protein n=1 Tax=Emergomyces pasteurianus Ep9510 TaxID=1447872 RepID=A0A1J9Q5C4_9EURO|nr:hypothetical protein AJ78_07769 [Emergomyces pasteurianus Ep9510]
MPNANHGARRSSSTASDIKGGGNTSRRDEIMEIHSQALEMIEILERMSTILEAIERGSKERYDAADSRASAREDRDAARNIGVPQGTSKMSTRNAGQGSLIITGHGHLRIKTNYSLVVLVGYKWLLLGGRLLRWHLLIVDTKKLETNDASGLRPPLDV